MSDFLDLSASAKSQLLNSAGIQNLVEAIATDLKNEIREVMESSDPAGVFYTVPGTKTRYQASAPGQPPAIREGTYAAAWKSTPAVVDGDTVRAAAVNDRMTEDGEHFIGEILEYGAPNLLPRPHIAPATAIVAERWGAKLGGQR